MVRTEIYELSAKGLAYLNEQDAVPHRATTLSRRQRSGTPNFAHAMMIVDALVEVELKAIANPDTRFVPVDEILARAPDKTRSAPNPLAVPVTIPPNKAFPKFKRPWQTHIIPDGLYGIEYMIEGENDIGFGPWNAKTLARLGGQTPPSPVWRAKSWPMML